MTNSEIKIKYYQMLSEVDKVYPVKGKINCYTCESCGHITKCTHIDQGVTPFMHACEACGKMAQSSFFKDICPESKPTEEWYRPSLEEVLNMDAESGTFEHVINGGLLCRKIQHIFKLSNIPNITEHKAIALFDEKFGKDKITRFLKVREEFLEMSEAFSEYLETGNDEHLRDEICDLQATVTHLASLFDLYQKQMLNTATDKVIKRESDPDYKRHRRIGIVFPAGNNRFESEAAMLSTLFNENPKGVIIGVPYTDTIDSKEAAVSVLEKINSFVIKSREFPISFLEPQIKSTDNIIEKKPKPWDRKEINRHSKPSFKSNRRRKS